MNSGLSAEILSERLTGLLPRPHIGVWLPASLAALLAIKVAFLLAYGPTVMPDTSGYVAFADAILADQLNKVGLAEVARPDTLFRIIGYPAILAAAKAISPGQWPWLVVGAQFAVSLVATVAVYRLSIQFGLSAWAARAVSAAQATSLPLVLDQALLTDSLNASLLTLAGCALSAAVLARRPLTALAGIAVGIAFVVAFLLREAMLILAVGFAPLAAAAAFADRLPFPAVKHTRRPLWLGMSALVLIFLPLALGAQLYRDWNRSRVGAAIVTTGAEMHVVDALIKASRYAPDIFAGDAPLDKVARQVTRTYHLSEAIQASEVLFRDFGRNAVEMSADAYAAYFRAWREYPSAMVRHALSHVKEWQAQLTVRPMDSIRELILWNDADGDDHNFASERAVTQGLLWMAPVVVLRRASQAAAVVVFAFFLLVTPWRALRHELRSPTVVAGLALWMLYLAFVAIYLGVHLEPRYLAPVIPWSIVVGAVNMTWLLPRLGALRGAPAAAPVGRVGA